MRLYAYTSASQTDGRTDGRTTYDSSTALALRASRGKNGNGNSAGVKSAKGAGPGQKINGPDRITEVRACTCLHAINSSINLKSATTIYSSITTYDDLNPTGLAIDLPVAVSELAPFHVNLSPNIFYF